MSVLRRLYIIEIKKNPIFIFFVSESNKMS